MAVICPDCGTAAKPGDRFCGACGADLLPYAGGVATPAGGGPGKRPRLPRLAAGLAAAALAVIIFFVFVPKTVITPPVTAPALSPLAEALKARLVGQVYEGGLDLEGWEDLGGGLIAEPVWFQYYQRADGAYLVLANLAQPRASEEENLPFRIADLVLIPPLEEGQELAFECRAAGGGRGRVVIAVVRPDHAHEAEWWRDVAMAWEISRQSGRLKPVAPKGIECVNESWGL